MLAGSVVLVAAVALGQWQVNNQVGRVNNRVGGELYGNNTNMGSVRYAAMTQTSLLPSEARYATWRSGALPSEIRMNALATGPLAPNGAISYIPSQSTVQAAMKLPQPDLYNPAYNIGGRPMDAQLAPQPGFGASGGSVRYAGTPAAPTAGQISGQLPSAQVPSAQVSSARVGASSPVQPLPSGQLPSGQLYGLTTPAPSSAVSQMLSPSGNNGGSIRYGSLSPQK
jgi:hypothetical protein